MKIPSKKVEVKYIDNEGALKTKYIELKNRAVINQYISYFNVCRNWGLNQFMNSQGSVLYEENQV
jgi:hypothetical protein